MIPRFFSFCWGEDLSTAGNEPHAQKVEKAPSKCTSSSAKGKKKAPMKSTKKKATKKEPPRAKPQAPKKEAKTKFFYVPVKETGSGPSRWCTYRACLPTVAVPVSLLAQARSEGGTVVQFLDGSLMRKLHCSRNESSQFCVVALFRIPPGLFITLGPEGRG